LTNLASSSAPAAGQVVTGVLGFLVVAGMGVALYFLLRSMNKQLRKVVREPRWREEARRGEQPGGTGDSGGGEFGGAGKGAGAGDGAGARPEQDYSRNGTGHPG
jgi:hypothetical protein